MSILKTIKEFFPNVETVTEATSNVVVEVTKRDINSSAVKKHDACAMAVACKRKFDLDGVIVSRRVAYLIKNNVARRYRVPESVAREIVSFDRGSGFMPGSYHLERPAKSVSLKAQRERDSNRPRGDRGSKPKKTRHITTNIRQVLGGMKPED